MTHYRSARADTPPRAPDRKAATLFGRCGTLLASQRLLAGTPPAPVAIVETGAPCKPTVPGRSRHGWNTVAWGQSVQQVVGNAITTDRDGVAIKTGRRVTSARAGSLANFVSDSVGFLVHWARERHTPIHLLYSNSLDWIHQDVSATHNRREVQVALPPLWESALLLIDDMHPTGGGTAVADRVTMPEFTEKGTRTVPQLPDRGFRLEFARAGQVLPARG